MIDDHGAPVSDAVWALWPRPGSLWPGAYLIEWDTNIPELAVLCAEAHTAERFVQRAEEAGYAGVA